MKVTVVAGNPKAGSRTLDAANMVAAALTGSAPEEVVDVVTLGAGPAHAMAPDPLLEPVLVELGATCPAPGLYLLDSTYTADTRIADYSERWAPVLRSTVQTEAS